MLEPVHFAPDDGTATFVAHLAPGPIDNGWFGSAFTDPMGAEVHVGLHNHGPVIASMRDEMLTTFRGGCTDESLPPSIQAAYAPTFGIRAGDPVTFKTRTFRTTHGSEIWDFGWSCHTHQKEVYPNDVA